MGLGDEAGLKAVEELEKTALPQILREINDALGVFNLKVANVIDLGNKFLTAVNTLLPIQVSGSIGGMKVEFTLGKKA